MFKQTFDGGLKAQFQHNGVAILKVSEDGVIVTHDICDTYLSHFWIVVVVISFVGGVLFSIYFTTRCAIQLAHHCIFIISGFHAH